MQRYLLIFSQFTSVIRNFFSSWNESHRQQRTPSNLPNSSAQALACKCQTHTGCFLPVSSAKCRKDEQKLLALIYYLTKRGSSLKPEFKPMLHCSKQVQRGRGLCSTSHNFLYETCSAIAPFFHAASASTPKHSPSTASSNSDFSAKDHASKVSSEMPFSEQ